MFQERRTAGILEKKGDRWIPRGLLRREKKKETLNQGGGGIETRGKCLKEKGMHSYSKAPVFKRTSGKGEKR